MSKFFTILLFSFLTCFSQKALAFKSSSIINKSLAEVTLVAEAEAEDGILEGVSVSSAIPGYSGTGYVTGFDNSSDMVTVSVEVPSNEMYRVVIRYNSPSGGKTQDVLVNGGSSTPVKFPDEPSYASVYAGIFLFRQGSNTISVKSSWGWMDVDKFEVYTVEANEFNIAENLVDQSPTEELATLYDFLKLQFGKRIISGQTSGYVNSIKALTNRTPLINNGDLMSYTEGYPYAWDGGHTFGAVDDGRVDEMINWYNSTNGKGIVAFQWHWCSPSGGEAGTNTFYTDQTSFDVRLAVVPGNQEYTDIIRDIDAVATQLKKFQDAGIPVVWRPLHEAGGGWFWWGAQGPAACIELYNIMYERLQEYHGLHNLLWVWSSPEATWYPGNDKVDIIGHDSYPGEYNYSAQRYAFDILFETTGGKKLIAMTENGPIPDPEECFNIDAPWLWFMSWDDLVYEQNSNEHILEVFGHSQVITLESDNAVIAGSRSIYFSSENELIIWPNPVKKNLNIQVTGSSSDEEIILYNAKGTLIHRQFVDEKEFMIDMTSYSPGTYFISLKNKEKCIRYLFIKIE